MNLDENRIFAGGSAFCADTDNILALYDFSEIAKVFPITKIHLETIM